MSSPERKPGEHKRSTSRGTILLVGRGQKKSGRFNAGVQGKDSKSRILLKGKNSDLSRLTHGGRTGVSSEREFCGLGPSFAFNHFIEKILLSLEPLTPLRQQDAFAGQNT